MKIFEMLYTFDAARDRRNERDVSETFTDTDRYPIDNPWLWPHVDPEEIDSWRNKR